MNLKKCEEILSRYEDKIDQKKLNDWILDLATIDQDPEDDEPFSFITTYLKTKEEIIAELIEFGLEKTDASELEKALHMSKGEDYSEGQNFEYSDDSDDIADALTSAFEGLTQGLEDFNEDDENLEKN